MNDRMPQFTILNVIIVSVVVISCYSITPYIGAGLLNCIDDVLFGLRWLDVHSPIPAALLLGALIGAAVGYGHSLSGSGKPRARRIAIGGVLGVALLLALGGFAYRCVMPPTRPIPAPAAPVAAQ